MSPKELRKTNFWRRWGSQEDARVVWLFFVPILSDLSVSLSAPVNMKTLILFAGFCGGKLVSHCLLAVVNLRMISYFVSRCFMKGWQISIIFCLFYSLESIFSVSKICCG